MVAHVEPAAKKYADRVVSRATCSSTSPGGRGKGKINSCVRPRRRQEGQHAARDRHAAAQFPRAQDQPLRAGGLPELPGGSSTPSATVQRVRARARSATWRPGSTSPYGAGCVRARRRRKRSRTCRSRSIADPPTRTGRSSIPTPASTGACSTVRADLDRIPRQQDVHPQARGRRDREEPERPVPRHPASPTTCSGTSRPISR